MARKARQRISYVLPLADQTVGHRLGVNGIAIDQKRSVLYSGGRDGVICAWNLDIDLDSSTSADDSISDISGTPHKSGTSTGKSQYWKQVQAHTHWINDLVLADDDRALISASSDVSVKLWRPLTTESTKPHTIGLHSDYVKCLACPGPDSTWVASGGLDRKISLWDLGGGGHHLQINTADEEVAVKGSVYAIDAKASLIASGGPESIVKVWDARTGRRVTTFVGHTDNIRSILINQEGDTILTASSDQTVKVWSMVAARCMYTLTMHNDSVWSLYSRHPRLSVFYSGDRSGLVARTDTRGAPEMDEGLSVALCQERQGVNKIVTAGNSVWTATSSSNINRWEDFDTSAGIQAPEIAKPYRLGSTSRMRALSGTQPNVPSGEDAARKSPISPKSVLRLSNFSPFATYIHREQDRSTGPNLPNSKRNSPATFDPDSGVVVPIRSMPAECIEGLNGLTKHVMLNDKRRVLAVDTAGEVVMWDIVRCIPTKSFGKSNLEDVTREVNTVESIPHWCAVDTRTGSLTCVLEQNHCFDAEVYADELEEAEKMNFREDQRINLGKWVLRYLFAGLIDEEIRRDEVCRRKLTSGEGQDRHDSSKRRSVDWNIQDSSLATPRPQQFPLKTPGLSIGVMAPGIATQKAAVGAGGQLSQNPEDASTLQRSGSQSHTKSSWERASDYFSSKPQTNQTTTGTKALVTPNGTQDENGLMPSTEPEKDTPTSFSKRLRMPFSARKSGRTQNSDSNKQAIAEEKTDDSDSKSSKAGEPTFEDTFQGSIQRIRQEYIESLNKTGEMPASRITPSLPNETPVLKPPPTTRIVIQEDHPDSGEVADLYEGTVGTVQNQADLIEKVAPLWLGNVLLRNSIPLKEPVRVLFVLEPYENLLPSLPTVALDNDRLNASRMLRARKILAYVAERLQVAPGEPEDAAMKPEDYLELYCQNQLIPPLMTLATVRANIWRNPNDVILQYKGNGRRKFVAPPAKLATEQQVRNSQASDAIPTSKLKTADG